VVEPVRSRDHTERLLRWLGVSVAEGEHVGGRHRVALEGPARPQGRRVEVPGDFSAAAFLLAAALLRPGSEVRLRGVGLNPTRAGLLEALARMGAEVRLEEAAPAGEEPRGDVRVTGTSTLRATSIEEREVPALVDEIPIWAVAAACARGRSTLRGAGELRVKESDRLAMLARNLRAVGVAAEERADGLTVEGGRLHGGTVESGGDHRIAMAFAVAGLAAAEPVTVLGIESVGTSFPGFFTALEALGAHCTFHETGPGR
jgi:3-phosphoshikimate 1-carboxyvinyltransferase